MTSHHASLRHEEQSKAEAHARRAGYKVGGHVDEEQDRKQTAEMIHKHERHDHKGESLTRYRAGGEVKGREACARPDRRARGGKVGKGPSKVNIVIATGGGAAERQQAQQQGMQIGARLAASAPRPPMMPPPGAGLPPGSGMPPPGVMPPGAGLPPGALPPRPGMPPMKRGGGIYPLHNAGSGGAEGRLQKAGLENLVPVKAHSRRKAGGRV